MSNLFSDDDRAKQPTHIYYDALINNSHSIDEIEPFIKFNEARDTPILEQPHLYKMSVVRFQLDSHTLPTFIPTIMNKSDQDKYFSGEPYDMNKTVYSITIQKYDGIDTEIIQSYVEFVPQNTTINVPSSFLANGEPNYSNGYYNLFSYEHFISMVNNTIINMIGDNLLPDYGINTAVPTFIYDSNNKIVLQSPYEPNGSNGWNSGYANDYHIYLNTSLYRLFNSLSFQYISHNDQYQRNYLIKTSNFNNNVISLTNYHSLSGQIENATGQQFLITSQDYSTVQNWSPISSIAFVSNSIMVDGNHASALHSYKDGVEIVDGSTKNSIYMITDLTAPEYVPGILYTPTVYRYINMKDSGPLRNLNFEIYYITKRGDMIPMKLSAGGSCSVKLLFELK
jgi:hypothetical protein